MRRSIAFILLVAFFSGCSSVPRTELRLVETQTGETSEMSQVDASVELADGDLPAHAILEKPHSHAVWVKGQYRYSGGRYIWVPGHWRDTAVAR